MPAAIRIPAIRCLIPVVTLLAGATAGAAAQGRASGASTLASQSAAVAIEVIGQTGGLVGAVADEGRWAYVGVGPRLVVVDLVDPASPREVARSEPLGGVVRGINLDGGLIFVAASEAGLVVLDCGEPDRPYEVGRLQLAAPALAVAIGGGMAYVAAEAGGLYAVDVSDPGRPATLAVDVTQGEVLDVALAGPQAVTVEEPGRFGVGATLSVYDVADPRSIRPVRFVPLPESGAAVAVSNGHALVVGGAVLTAVDIRGDDPTRVATIVLDGVSVATDIAIEGDVALVATHEGLIALDVSVLSAPRQLGTFPMQNALAVAARGSSALVAAGDRLRAVDVRDSAAPNALGVIEWIGEVIDVAVAADRAFATDGSGSLWIADVIEPNGPLLLGALHEPGLRGILTATRDLVVLRGRSHDARGASIVDVVDPAAPRLVGEIEDPVSEAVYVAGLLWIQSGSTLKAFDLSDPGNPRRAATYAARNTFDFVAADGARAFLMGGGCGASSCEPLRLEVVDLSVPSEPLWAASFERVDETNGSDDWLTDFAVDGATAYALTLGELTVLDVSAPSRVRLTEIVPVGGGGLAVTTEYVVIRPMRSDEPFQVVDRRRPSTGATAVTVRGIGTYGSDLVSANDVLYVAGYDTGMTVARVTKSGSGPTPVPPTPEPADRHVAFLPVVSGGAAAADTPSPTRGAGTATTTRSGPVETPSATSTPMTSPAPVMPTLEPPLRLSAEIGGAVHSVARSGDLVAFGIGTRLAIADITRPDAVRVLGESAPLRTMLTSLAWKDGVVFAVGTTSDGGLYAIDVVDPTRPHVMRIDEPEDRRTGPNRWWSDLALVDDTLAVGGSEGLELYDVSDVAAPRALGHVEISGNVDAVAVDGGLALVAAGRSVHVVDIGDGSMPRHVGQWDDRSGVYEVAVDGNRAFALAGGHVRVLDVTDPADIREIAAFGASCDGIWLSGSTLFVDEGGQGYIAAYDVSDAERPTEVASIDVLDDGWAYDVTFDGRQALMAAGDAGLQLAAVRRWQDIRRLPDIPMPDDRVASAMTVNGNYGYFGWWRPGRGGSGVSRYDLSDPATPIEVDSVTLPDVAGDMADMVVHERRLFVAVGREVHVVDLDGGRPIAEAGTYEHARELLALAASGGRLYALDVANQVLVLDIDAPGDPRLGAALQLDPPPSEHIGGDLAIGDGVLFVARDSLAVVDVSDPDRPVLAAALADLPAASVEAAGRLAYAAVCDTGLVVVDAVDPTAPAVLGSTWTFSCGLMALDAGHAYLTAGGTVEVVDIGEPRRPRHVGTAGVDAMPQGVAVAGRHIYVLFQRTLVVFEARALADTATEIVVPTLGSPIAVAMGDGRLYAADRSGRLSVVDLAGSAARVRGSVRLELCRNVRGICHLVADGDLVTFADYGGGFGVVDVTDPDAPQAIGHLPFHAVDFVVSGRYAYLLVPVAVDRAGWFSFSRLALVIVDLGDPTHPFVTSMFQREDDPIRASALAIESTNVYVFSFYEMVAVDIEDAAHPREVGSVKVDLLSVLGDAVVRGDMLFAVSGLPCEVCPPSAALVAVDVSDPTTPTKVGDASVGSGAFGALATLGHRAVAAGDHFSDGFVAIDLSDPRWPAAEAALSSGAQTHDVAADGAAFWVAAGEAGLQRWAAGE